MSPGRSALPAVQAAVMAILTDGSPLSVSAPGGVWDYVPADPTWPYVCLESADEVPDDTYGAQGRKVRLTFSIFSLFQGRAEQFTILNDLVELLTHTHLVMAGSPGLLSGWEQIGSALWYVGSQAISPFEVGNTRAGSTSVTFEVQVMETAP